ncbi:MAG: TolC family protein, partial [Gemmatimonadetes bacterium]|nr:TolC family protein [Gemmatimonadota bacterium]
MGMDHRFLSYSSARVGRACIGATLLTLGASVTARAQRRDTTTTQVLRVTREDAIKQALTRNPTLAVARAQVAQAQARVTQAYALPEPSFGASVVGQTGAFSWH